MVDSSIVQDDGSFETAVNYEFGQNVSNGDHQYFNSSAFTSPASPSSSILFSSSSTNNFDFESLLQQQHDVNNDLFSTSITTSSNDTADIQQYLINNSSSMIVKAESQNSNILVPATPPTLNFDPDFPPLGDDILEQALKSLGDFTKFADNTTFGQTISNSLLDGQSLASTSDFDFPQREEYTDPVWEESFAQLFPSLSS